MPRRPARLFLLVVTGAIACAEGAAGRDSTSVRDAADSGGATTSGFDTTRMAPAAAVPSSLPSGYVVDSAIPIPEAIRRFQATVPTRPSALADGGTSLDDLFAKYVDALARHDTLGLRRLVLTRAEFAWLYYPDSRYTRDPYNLQPDFVWRFAGDNGEAGVSKALARYGAKGWTYRGHRCSKPPRTDAAIRLHGPCTLLLRSPDGVDVESPLVSEVVQRNGRFKMTGFANEL